MSYEPYNPLAITNLGKSVAEALLEQPLAALPPSLFNGPGVYAIYYSGEHTLYQRERSLNIPIYVGKAVSKGARKGDIVTSQAKSRALFERLNEHAESIGAAPSLDLKDFTCRFLVVEDIWIPLGESLLIKQFKPIWNLKIDGFGNHDPGSGRYNQKKSLWDILHQGRNWAERLKGDSKSFEEVVILIEAYVRSLDK
jgi:hypothetical protein